MNRAEEMALIEQHIEENGVYRCRMGECHYGDDLPSYKERMWNQRKNRPPKSKLDKVCQQCGENYRVTKAQKARKYCSPECAYKGSAKAQSRSQPFPCFHCKKIHMRPPSMIRQPEKMFCSQDCARKALVGKVGKPVTYQGVDYASVTACARAHNTTYDKMRYLVNKEAK